MSMSVHILKTICVQQQCIVEAKVEEATRRGNGVGHHTILCSIREKHKQRFIASRADFTITAYRHK